MKKILLLVKSCYLARTEFHSLTHSLPPGCLHQMRRSPGAGNAAHIFLLRADTSAELPRLCNGFNATPIRFKHSKPLRRAPDLLSARPWSEKSQGRLALTSLLTPSTHRTHSGLGRGGPAHRAHSHSRGPSWPRGETAWGERRRRLCSHLAPSAARALLGPVGRLIPRTKRSGEALRAQRAVSTAPGGTQPWPPGRSQASRAVGQKQLPWRRWRWQQRP